MAEVAFGSLQWQKAASNSPDLVAPYACDFTAASSYRFSPRGTLATTPGTVSGAQGVIIDNMLNGVALQMQCGPIIEICPAFQKTFIQLDPLASLDVVIAGSSGMARVYFFTGAFHGNTQNVNTYAAYKAGVVSTNTDGTQDVYFNSIRWKVDYNLAPGFNLDNLTDSGFFDVLNPVSPASGNLPAGTWLIESHVYSSSNLYSYQQARNILSPDTQVYERRQLGGSGWTPWRNIGLTISGGDRFLWKNATQCQLIPMNGGLLTVNGNQEQVPASLIFYNTLQNVAQGGAAMAALTVYYAYVYMLAGVMMGEWSTTAPIRDARGLLIKSGDPTRTCVGGVYTNSNAQFQDDVAFRGVGTARNRTWRNVDYQQQGVNITTPTSAAPAQIPGFPFWSWGDDSSIFNLWGYAFNHPGGSCYWYLAADGVLSSANGVSIGNTNWIMAAPVTIAGVYGLGIHGIGAAFNVDANTQGVYYYRITGMMLI